MAPLRPTSDHDRERIKAATGRGIERAGGGTSFATQTRVEPSALSKYKAPHEDGHFMPIDVALDCDLAAGAPTILAAMASIQGYKIMPIVDAPAHLCSGLVGRIIRETGELSAVVLDAMSDGHLTPAEKQRIEKELDEAIKAMWELRAAVRGA